MSKHWIYILLIVISSLACEEEQADLPSVEERTSEAIEDLRDELTDPTNGWKVSYQPTPESGSFFMLLTFDDDGNLNIQSDISAEEGIYFDQTITYRIDAGLSLELIFETYGVFHYLFELDQASFGAEFELLYSEEEDGNLIFTSKSDLFDQTTIVFEPAGTNDADLFSREMAQNFSAYSGQGPQFVIGFNPSQQLYLSGADISIFWTVNLLKRSLSIDLAGPGSSLQEVLSGSYQSINQATGYTFLDGKLVLNNPVNINTGGTSFSLSEISLGDFSETGPELCLGSGDLTPNYSATVTGAGTGQINKSLFNSSGLTFEPTQTLFSVNIPFIFDDSLRSLSEEGSIAGKLPSAAAFLMSYGLEDDTIPENSVGFYLEYENDSTAIYLRSFNPTQVGNRLELELLDEYYHTDTVQTGEQQALMEITDEIFEGGSVYAYDLPIRGLTAWHFYNPCNRYEFVLLR